MKGMITIITLFICIISIATALGSLIIPNEIYRVSTFGISLATCIYSVCVLYVFEKY